MSSSTAEAAADLAAMEAAALMAADADGTGEVHVMSRQQVEAFRASLRKGRRVTITWRYGESSSTRASAPMTWRGTVINEEENDDDARRALILYDKAQPCLEHGGKIQFPPPLLGDRQPEILRAEQEKIAGALPDLGILFDRSDDVPLGEKRQRDGSACQQPATKAAPQAPGHTSPVAATVDYATNSVLEGAEQIAAAMKGETLFVPLAVNLRVPKFVSTSWSVLYPNLWWGRPVAEWRALLTEMCLEKALVPENDRERRTLFAKRDGLVAWMATATVKPSTKEEWRLPFDLSAEMAATFVYARTGYEGKNRFMDDYAKAYDSGKLDFERLIETVTAPKSTWPPKNGPRRTNTQPAAQAASQTTQGTTTPTTKPSGGPGQPRRQRRRW
jgi:hypothetical protein